MRFSLLALVFLIPLALHGQSSIDSVYVCVYNTGKYYIKSYSISVDNKDYKFKDIPKGECSNSIKLPFIWTYNRTEAEVIMKHVFKRDKLITETLQPLDHEGDIKYTKGRFRIMVSTNFKYGRLWLDAHLKKDNP